MMMNNIKIIICYRLQEVCTLNERLNAIGMCTPLHVDVCNAIWENVAHLITHTLVEGYVRKRLITKFLNIVNITNKPVRRKCNLLLLQVFQRQEVFKWR